MPRIKMESERRPPRVDQRLVALLADELKAGREAGQPHIWEETFTTGRIQITVIWDEWHNLTHQERTAVIHAAVEQADGQAYRDRVGLASGVTVPEAVASGMLPYTVTPALRKTDPVTPAQCREVMLAEGASALFGPGVLQLRFPSEEAAEACRRRLIRRLPGSDEVWLVGRDVTHFPCGPTTDEWE